MNKKLFILSAVISLFLTIILWNTCDWTTGHIVDYLRDKHYFLNAWILHHYVFALSFGLIPFLSFLLWTIGKRKKKLVLLAYIFLCWATTIVLSILVFKYLVIDLGGDSILLPEFKVFNVPYYEYWNHTLPKMALVAPVFLFVVNIVHRIRLDRLQNSIQPLDQNTEEK